MHATTSADHGMAGMSSRAAVRRMSGIATQLAARHLKLPAVQTFLRPGRGDVAVIGAASCTDELFELARMGRSRARMSVIPRGVNLETVHPPRPRHERHRLVSVGKLVPHNGFDIVIRVPAPRSRRRIGVADRVEMCTRVQKLGERTMCLQQLVVGRGRSGSRGT